jgi:hypothetical protein
MVPPPLSSSPRCRHVIAVSQVILSHPDPRSHLAAVPHRRPLHPRHEPQHQGLAGARPLERAYCHESVSVALATSSPIYTVALVLVH